MKNAKCKMRNFVLGFSFLVAGRLVIIAICRLFNSTKNQIAAHLKILFCKSLAFFQFYFKPSYLPRRKRKIINQYAMIAGVAKFYVEYAF